jgi:hypothetical protein
MSASGARAARGLPDSLLIAGAPTIPVLPRTRCVLYLAAPLLSHVLQSHMRGGLMPRNASPRLQNLRSEHAARSSAPQLAT